MTRAILTGGAVLLALAACGGDPTGGVPTPAGDILIDGNNVGPSFGLVFIRQDGQSVSDGSVTVTANGVAATPASGGYAWQLANPLAAGATLTVQASRLGKTATVTGTLPATPVLVAPALNDPVTIGQPLTVTWTSPTDPAYFVIHLGYRVGSTGTSVGDSVAGNVRTISLETATIPAGATNFSIDIRAIGADTRGGDVEPASKLRLYATTENRDLTVGVVPILLVGGDMGETWQNFGISRGGADMSTAIVRINGTVIPTSATGFYSYQLPTSLIPGEELVVEVTHDGDTVEGRATILPPPVLAAPATNQVVTAGTPLAFSWTAPTDASLWQLRLGYQFNGGAAGGGLTAEVAGTARTGALPVPSLPADATDLEAYVFGYLDGTFTGPADPASSMRVRIASSAVTLVKGP